MQGLMNERGEPCHVSLDLPPCLLLATPVTPVFTEVLNLPKAKEGWEGSLHTPGFKDPYSMVEIRLNVLTCCFCLITLSICTNLITFISGGQIEDTTDWVHGKSLPSKKVTRFCFWICLCCLWKHEMLYLVQITIISNIFCLIFLQKHNRK